MFKDGKDIFIMIIISVLGWLLSFIWLGWIGNAAMWLWSESKKTRPRSATKKILAHTVSFLLGFVPFIPSAAVQAFLLYKMEKQTHEQSA